jgi:hypothetical protein
LTKNGKLPWTPTLEDNKFRISFSDFSVEIFPREYSTPDYDSMDYVIAIINELGTLIEDISDRDLHKAGVKNSYDLMLELYEMARSRALGVDIAITKILNHLDELDDSVPEEDIPF